MITMKRKNMVSLFAYLIIMTSCGGNDTPSDPDGRGITPNNGVIELKDNQRGLSNPGMGWNQMFYTFDDVPVLTGNDKSDNLNWIPCDILSFRVSWAKMEPKEGQYNWKVIDNAANYWLSEGKRLAFKFYTNFLWDNPDRQATPLWLKDAGAKGHYLDGNNDPSDDSWMADYGDPILLEKLEKFYKNIPAVPYIMEEYVFGDLVSYDAIVDAEGNPIFETGITWEPTIMDIVNEGLDLYYYVRKQLPLELIDAGRRTIKGFGVKSRFVHMEFFKLLEDRKGLGKKGDYIGLEVNMRPAGGYTPSMYNYANNTDVYQIWADMVTYGKIVNASLNEDMERNFCIYVSRRDEKNYRHSDEEVLGRYGDAILMYERMPDLYSAAMGNRMYTAKFKDKEVMDEFIKFVHETV